MQTDNSRGILLMAASMLAFAVEDMFIKFAAADMPTGQILLVFSLIGTPAFALIARTQGHAVLTRAVLHPAVIRRNVGEVIGSAGFITALALTPMTSAIAIFQAAPLVMTMGAAWFLGERVGWRRWSAIIAGFLGVLLVIRPGTDAFQVASLFSVVAVLGLCLRDLASRRVPATVSSAQLSTWAYSAMGLLGVAMLFGSGGAVIPTIGQGLNVLAATALGFVGYWMVTEASRLGEVAVITPFRYLRLIFAMIIGLTVFGERPDALTFVGAGIIVASGLYTVLRERRLRRTLSPKAVTR